MDRKQERWAATGTGAVIVAVMAATWLTCENALVWHETFRIEDISLARDQVGEFEAYRPDGLFESGSLWAALVVAVVAVVVAAVAGVRARRWRPVPTAVIAAAVLVVLVVGSVLPFPFVLLVCAIPTTMAVLSLARPLPQGSRMA